MIIEIEKTKRWLRVDGEQDDDTIEILIGAAESYLANATEVSFDATNHLAKLFCYTLVADWFENRQLGGEPSDKIRFTISSMLAQLQHGYKPPGQLTEAGGEQ
ncbi:head-tail connector protein [Cohnella yongneupensis]|uniref:Head-tail connector protein n=1 Tax=Cohnella yongneupensis TaxID=425006 RepID=A0ABW0R6C4_9BACL